MKVKVKIEPGLDEPPSVWEYEGLDGRWNDFDDGTCLILSEAKRAGTSNNHQCARGSVVDLASMVEIWPNGMRRAVRTGP